MADTFIVPGQINFNGVAQTLAKSSAAVSVTNTTAETELFSFTVPANSLGASGTLMIRTVWSFTSPANANNKVVRIKLGGTTFCTSNNANIITLAAQNYITNRGLTNQQIAYTPITASIGAAAGTANTTGTIDTTAAQILSITAQLAVSTDTATLEEVSIQIVR